MTDTQKIVFSIIRFLNDQIKEGQLNEENKESLEVAIQCMETCFDVSSTDLSFDVGASLRSIFTTHLTTKSQAKSLRVVTDEEKERAEALKNQGNMAVKDGNLQEAISKYTEAIEIDGSSAAYYSNRAAAYTKLCNYELAIEDAAKALSIDPSYTKAHSRMALACAGLNRFTEAHAAIKRALELEPDNESYKNNLQAIEARLNETHAPDMNSFNLPNMSGLDSFMNNPTMINMANQLMQNPQMQQMMANVFSSAMSSNSNTGNSSMEMPNLQNLIQSGQQFAEQIQSSHPELVTRMRQQMGLSEDQQEPENSPNT